MREILSRPLNDYDDRLIQLIIRYISCYILYMIYDMLYDIEHFLELTIAFAGQEHCLIFIGLHGGRHALEFLIVFEIIIEIQLPIDDEGKQ